jgi:hypothetical protein
MKESCTRLEWATQANAMEWVCWLLPLGPCAVSVHGASKAFFVTLNHESCLFINWFDMSSDIHDTASQTPLTANSTFAKQEIEVLTFFWALCLQLIFWRKSQVASKFLSKAAEEEGVRIQASHQTPLNHILLHPSVSVFIHFLMLYNH